MDPSQERWLTSSRAQRRSAPTDLPAGSIDDPLSSLDEGVHQPGELLSEQAPFVGQKLFARVQTAAWRLLCRVTPIAIAGLGHAVCFARDQSRRIAVCCTQWLEERSPSASGFVQRLRSLPSSVLHWFQQRYAEPIQAAPDHTDALAAPVDIALPRTIRPAASRSLETTAGDSEFHSDRNAELTEGFAAEVGELAGEWDTADEYRLAEIPSSLWADPAAKEPELSESSEIEIAETGELFDLTCSVPVSASAGNSSPTSARRLLWRELLVMHLIVLGGLVLAGRLAELHLYRGDEFARQANRQRSFLEVVPARPGDITDREGRLLATSIAVRSLYVVPKKMDRAWEICQEIATALELDADDLFARIAAHPDREFLWVQRRLSDAHVARIQALGLPPECWGFRDEYRRYYPQGTAAVHLVGFRDIDGRGRAGIEERYQSTLRGQDGERTVIRDALGRTLDVQEQSHQTAIDGVTVRMSIDIVIQLYTERALDEVVREWKPKSCCAIVLDPITSEVLAMASRPAFDPNRPAEISPDAWKNRPVHDVYEPGSTFKPFVVAWAMQHGLLQRDELFHCEHGEYRMGKRLLHDHHSYGQLSVTDILVKSSNIGMAKIGERMGKPLLFDAAASFGFGMSTGIELPGELNGLLRPLPNWNSYSTGSVPMGQEIAVTPIQMITGYGALANGGTWISPRIVLSLSNGDTPAGQVRSELLSREIADWIVREPLRQVVVRGTGKKAEIPGYEVFGKSGTAQKPDPVTGVYSNRRHVSSFVCGAPASQPRVLVLVSVDEPSTAGEHFGGTIAAPPAKVILEKTLRHLQVPLPVHNVASDEEGSSR